MIWTYIKAEKFFPEYCPEIKNYKRKISKKNGRGNPVDFTKEEKKLIRARLRIMIQNEATFVKL